MYQSPLEGLFNPRSVAVFGASETEGKVGARVFAKLQEGGFAGRVTPINPKYASVLGVPCLPSLDEGGIVPDLAVVATPAATVAGIIAECGKAGVRNAIILSAGFAETGEEGRRRQTDLKETARRHKVRLLGPNCLGLVRPWLGLDATFLKAPPPAGELALISQSGALCSAISDWAVAHGLGFSALVSLGNAADVGFGASIRFLATDPKTRAILLYVEGLRDAGGFLSAIRGATRLKPVIVLKAGRHGDSSRAAHTHTGALMGSDAVFDAALARAGAVRVHSFGQLFAAAEILGANQRARGNRLGIVTNGGGAGVLAADRAGDLDVRLEPPSAATIEALDKHLPPYWSRGNPIDILGDASPEVFGVAVRAALADPAFDGLLVMLTPQAMTDALSAAKALVEALPAKRGKPVLACWMGEGSVAEARRYLSENGVPDFTTPERAVEAFSYLVAYHRARQLALETPGPLEERDTPDLDGVRMILDSALKEGRSLLSDIESKAVLRVFSVPVNPTIHAADASEALVAAESLGFPVAMKVASPDVSHKSDVGGVRTGIATAPDVMAAFRAIEARVRQALPDARLEGVTVEPMADIAESRELVVGVSRDPVFGPAILLGAGGTMVEALRTHAVGLPPLNAVLAGRMLDDPEIATLLGALRNRRAVDRAALADVLLRVSEMVCELPEITELDINPLVAGPEGVLAVDARIAVARPRAGGGDYDHVAIPPYPRHLVREDHLADGTPLTIRPIRPEDAEGEVEFVADLSEEAKRFRFMGTVKALTPEMLERFTQIDYRREMALVAIVGEGSRRRQRGVCRYVRNPDETSCEFAVVVSDRLQHQGIGTRLMTALMAAARDQGLRRIEGAVLKENTGMLRLMDDLGFRQDPDPDDRDLVLVGRDL